MLRYRLIRHAACSATACLLVAPVALAQPTPSHASVLPAEGTLTLEQIKSRYQDAASRYIKIGGMQIRYKDAGTGPVIVLLHGSHSSLDGYDGLAAELSAKYRVIRFDMPGMGLSETLPLSAQTDTPFGDLILEQLLDALKIEKVSLIGTSSGGALAYYFASHLPHRANALILANTPSEPVVDANTPRSPALRFEMDEAKRTGVRTRKYWATYLEWLHGDPSRLSAAKIDRYYDMNRRAPIANARLFWRSSGNIPDVYKTLSTVTTPTLLVWGKIDLVLPLHTMDSLRNKMPAAPISTVTLTDVGHYPPLEVPNRFAAIAEAYLTSVAK